MNNEIYIYILIVLAASCTPRDKSDKNIATKIVSKSWIGKWQRRMWQNDSYLEIKSIKNDSLEFTLFASSGGHTGELEGLAVVQDNLASFSEINDDDTCLVIFKLIGDTVISIAQKTGNCFTAIAVSYSGNYKNEKVLPKTENSETLFDLEIFKTRTQDSLFKSLVRQQYSLFVNSTQLTSEDEDLDSLRTNVHSSGVRGLFTFMENIIMIDSLNNIWAAVIDNNKIYYFTNREDFKSNLPKTIDNWRQNFKDYEVVYK